MTPVIEEEEEEEEESERHSLLTLQRKDLKLVQLVREKVESSLFFSLPIQISSGGGGGGGGLTTTRCVTTSLFSSAFFGRF